MSLPLSVLLLAFFHALCLGATTTGPIIGILTQPSVGDLRSLGNSYIAASYVKLIESAGARVVPIFHYSNQTELKRVFDSLNGILIPGGISEIYADNVDGTALFESASYLINLAITANDGGVYFPVLATCLGFELAHMVIAKDTDPESLFNWFDAEDMNAGLDFTTNSSRMFSSAPSSVIATMNSRSATMYNHIRGVSPTLYSSNKNPTLNNFFTVTAVASDRDRASFVAAVEAKKYPIYAVRWHPEKNPFEWRQASIPHGTSSVQASQFLSNFFVSEAMRNDQRFPSEKEEYSSLIYNYSPLYTELKVPDFIQAYVFTEETGGNCGNGELDDGEECDGTLYCNWCFCAVGYETTDPLSIYCQPRCGNGRREAEEICDGGSQCGDDCKCASGYGPTFPPSQDCIAQSSCGNSRLDSTLGEHCDGGEGCTSQCICEGGYKQTTPPSNSCRETCGDGIIDLGEQCDGGENCDNNHCLCDDEHATVDGSNGDCIIISDKNLSAGAIVGIVIGAIVCLVLFLVSLSGMWVFDDQADPNTVIDQYSSL